MRGLRMMAGMCALLLASQLAAETVKVKNVRIAHTGDRTRVVLDIDQASSHTLFTLANPNRVVVDLSNSRFATSGIALPAGKGLVANVRAANRANSVARLVLDLGEAVRPKSFVLPPSGGFGHRIVVDLYPADTVPVRVKTAPRREGTRDLIIAIDAGHGGKDPGARGRGGLLEKDAVLRIGQRLATLINDEPGMRAHMTRNKDEFLHLRQRMQSAEKVGADMFISIHADSFTDRRVRGATVYVLSAKGATDEAAKLLAQRENDADLLGGVDISETDDVVAKVLVDLSQNASLDASIEIGDLLIAELSRIGKVRKAGVQKAGFKVLKSPDIPSVLIETAFISNPQDESNLKSVQYQQRLARAMHNGIRGYFYKNPPAGTRIASLSKSRGQAQQYVIRRGDTLSGIAQRYNVSVARLQTENSLRDSRIRVGQTLRIPTVLGI